jgi:hypothetical protein
LPFARCTMPVPSPREVLNHAAYLPSLSMGKALA